MQSMDAIREKHTPMSVDIRPPLRIVGSARSIATAILLTILATTVGPWPTKPVLAAEQESKSTIAAAGPLDGRTFGASIVRASVAEQDRELGDKLMFINGMFASALCRKFNFGDAPYWIRQDGDQVHFLAEMTSPTDGKMIWKGTIRGDTLEGTMRWIKERWYWTIDTEHKIRGTLDTKTRGTRLSGE